MPLPDRNPKNKCQTPLTSRTQPMTIATPIPEANGIVIAKNPQISMRIPQIIFPLPVPPMEVKPFITFSPFRFDRPVLVSQYLSRTSVTTRIHLCNPIINDENGYRKIPARAAFSRVRQKSCSALTPDVGEIKTTRHTLEVMALRPSFFFTATCSGTGSVNQKVLPFLDSLSSPISPWCASTASRQKASPIPVECRCLPPLSVCPNFSKTRSCW